MIGIQRCLVENINQKISIARVIIPNLYDHKIKRYGFDVMVRLCSFFNFTLSDLLVLEE